MADSIKKLITLFLTLSMLAIVGLLLITESSDVSFIFHKVVKSYKEEVPMYQCRDKNFTMYFLSRANQKVRTNEKVSFQTPVLARNFMSEGSSESIRQLKYEIEKLESTLQGISAEIMLKNDVIEFLSQPIVNNHYFEYIHNPKNICLQTNDVNFLFVVPSAPENFHKRTKFRAGVVHAFVKNETNKAKLLFFLGKHPAGRENDEIKKKIEKEVADFQDTVQESYLDVYKNIRLKSVSMLKWACTFCRRARYVIRVDDDVRFDLPKAIEVIEDAGRHYKNFILGDAKIGWEPHRAKSSKYYISLEEYSETTWPPFAIGGLLAYPSSSVCLLYQSALRLRPIWLDDVFITAMCAPQVGVPLLSHPVFQFQH